MALRNRIAEDLINTSPSTLKYALYQRLINRLENEVGLKKHTAEWAVESWALALGILEKPIFTSTGKRHFFSKISGAKEEVKIVYPQKYGKLLHITIASMILIILIFLLFGWRYIQETNRLAWQESQKKIQEIQRLAEEATQRKLQEAQRLAEEEAQRKARETEEATQRKLQEAQRLAEEEAQRKAREAKKAIQHKPMKTSVVKKEKNSQNIKPNNTVENSQNNICPNGQICVHRQNDQYNDMQYYQDQKQMYGETNKAPSNMKYNKRYKIVCPTSMFCFPQPVD